MLEQLTIELEDWHKWLLIAMLLCGLFYLLFKAFSADSPTKILYSDKGIKSRAFASKRFKILAKPDLYEQIDSGNKRIREYKSRHSGFYHSDRVQLVATAIALRGAGEQVHEGVLETKNGEQHHMVFNSDTAALYEGIRNTTEQARLAVSGVEPRATPSRPKCSGCSFKSRCEYAL